MINQKMVNRFTEVDRRKIVELGCKSIWSSEGKEARDYLQEKRGFTPDVIKKFKIGYCPRGTSHQLEGRIITPFRDEYGNLVSITTRHLFKSKGDPYYFWHEVFTKSLFVFGLYESKYDIIKYRKAILVEGEMDVGFLHSCGIPVAVAACGSSHSLYQAMSITTYCSEVYLLFDGDNAGRNSMRRAMDIYRRYNMGSNSCGILYVPVELPMGMDPDDYVKEHGKKGILHLLKNSKEKMVKKL